MYVHEWQWSQHEQQVDVYNVPDRCSQVQTGSQYGQGHTNLGVGDSLEGIEIYGSY